ncbi:MAG TPA: hypothetical protein EYN26_07610 [Chromatiales bacterium]|nr:hypothetical protein [Chromatiales bacterium]
MAPANHKQCSRLSLRIVVLCLLLPCMAVAAEMDDVKLLIRLQKFDDAVELLVPLAESGLAQAQYQLGSLYRMGTGVAKDHVAAVRWFEQAATQSHDKSQYNLGLMYLNGWGAETDRAQARHWLALAAGNGHRLAAKKLEQLQSKQEVSVEQLFHLLRKDDKQGLIGALNGGASANAVDQYERSLLMEAAGGGQGEMLQVLLARKADADHVDVLGDTALLMAVRSGHKQIVDSLVKAGANLNVQDINGNSALMLAVQLRHSGIASRLLSARPSLHLRNKAAESVTDIAEHRNMPQVMVELQRQGAPSLTLSGEQIRNLEQTADAISQYAGSIDAAGVNVAQWPPLMLAVWREKDELAALLIQRGADINFHDTEGNSPLRLAVRRGDVKIIDLLRGAGVVEQDAYPVEAPLLHLAVRSRDIDTVKRVLAMDIDLDVRDAQKLTALEVSINQNSLDLAGLLLDAGFAVNALSENSRSPLMQATHGKSIEVLRLLIRKGARLNQVDATGNTALMLACREAWLAGVTELVYAGAERALRNQAGHTALSLAIISDQVGIVDQLLTTEATSGDRRYAGDTALMLAAGGGNVEILEKIIRLNPDIDAIDAAGNTALMWAVIAGHESTAGVLLAHGADRAMRNRNRDRAMDIAQRSGDVELIRVLKNAGLAARWF